MEIFGLLLTLCGLGAIFYIWLQLMGNRAKTADTVCEEEQEQIEPDIRPSLRLVPQMESVESTPEPLATEPSNQAVAEQNVPETQEQAEQDHGLPENKHLRTQLEIAHQLFETGDFEGACEMAEIVCESQHASETQIEKARQLIVLSASN